MWLGYEPTPSQKAERERKSKVVKRYHIKKKVSFFFIATFCVCIGLDKFSRIYSEHLWEPLAHLYLNYPWWIMVPLVPSFFMGVVSAMFSLSFFFIFRHDFYYVDLARKRDNELTGRPIGFLIWQEYWDEVYSEGEQK